MVQWFGGSWFSGSGIQWFSGSGIQCCSGSEVQWFSSSVVQWLGISVVQWLGGSASVTRNRQIKNSFSFNKSLHETDFRSVCIKLRRVCVAGKGWQVYVLLFIRLTLFD